MKRVSVYLMTGIIVLASTGCDLNDEDDEGVLIESSLAFIDIREMEITTVSGTPRITISTASGIAELRLN